MQGEDRVEFRRNSVDFVRTDTFNSEGPYAAMEELDEESISWNVLIARIVCIVLLVLIATAISLGATKNPRIYLLAIVLSVILVIFFMCSFMKLETLRSVTKWHGKFQSKNKLTANNSQSPLNSRLVDKNSQNSSYTHHETL